MPARISAQVSWPQSVTSDGVAIDLASARREVGGPVAVKRGAEVHLRVFLDHSALEAHAPPMTAMSRHAVSTASCCRSCAAQTGLIDTSCAGQQVFLGTGEALSTRMYRRRPPRLDGVSAGVHVLAHGGPVEVAHGAGYLMTSIWT